MAKTQICSQCGRKGTPKNHTKGNILIEIVLWLFFLLPGLIYSIWRLTTKQKVCPYCLAPAMVDLDSPRGQELVQKYGG